VKPLQPKHGGNSDIFVTKLNPAGSALVYATYLGGGSDDYATGGIAVDAEGNAYVTGETTSWDFPAVNPVQLEYGGGGVDVFVAKVNPTGSALVYATYLGGSGGDGGSGIAVDAEGNVYVTGYTQSLNFPTMNPIQPAKAGPSLQEDLGGPPPDAFVVRIADLPAATATPIFLSLPIPGWLLVGLPLGVVAIVLALVWQRRRLWRRR